MEEEKVDAEVVETEETDGKSKRSTESQMTEKKPVPIKYYLKNSVKYAFQSLKNEDGLVAKSKLQVVCANLCRVWNLPYSPEHLNEFTDKSALPIDEFMAFVENNLLSKVTVQNGDDILQVVSKLDDICWVIYIKENPIKDQRVLADRDAFQLWKVFKKMDVAGDLFVDREEVAVALEEFLNAIGTPWTPVPMDNYSKEDNWKFWDFLTCLELHYLKSTPKSVYKEGLDALNSKYVQGVVKAGFLTKKGHRVKSMKERWFVLLPSSLAYYTTKGSSEKKGDIIISENSKVENVPDGRGVRCRFSVTCGERQVKYEIDAVDQRTKNEWINAIQSCIECVGSHSPLEKQLVLRKEEREKKRALAKEEEQRRLEQEALIKQQIEQLEQLKLEREKADARAEEEAAMLEEERKRRAELEEMKREYERLLEEEKTAREAEEEVRLLQEKILDHEREKRLELEEIKKLQDKLLLQERERREGLEEESKEQARILEEERERMKDLQEARSKAEDALTDAHKKLEEAEEERRRAADAVEAAKMRTRNMKMPAGLARPIQGGSSSIITHRGLGAFIEQDFSKTPIYLSGEEPPVPVNATVVNAEERAVIEEPHLVRPSEQKPGTEQ